MSTDRIRITRRSTRRPVAALTRTAALAAAVTLAALTSLPSMAQVTPSDVRDLVGVRAPGGESELASRGYVDVGGRKADGASLTFWWNDRRGVCLSVTTREGRYESLVAAPASDCRRDAGRDTNRDPARDAPAAAANTGPLVLVCYGDGQRPAMDAKYGYEWDDKERRYLPKDRREWTTQHFDTSITLEIDGDRGRIMPAKNMIPPLHADADNGWFPLRNVAVSPEEIRGEFTLNAANHPKLKVDRRNGHIAIEGLTRFNGTCDRADAARRF